jgi:hypothetical protein
MKGKLKVRNIAPGFDEIFLQVHSGQIYKMGAAISCTNYFVDRSQWPEIVKQKLIDTEVEFEESKSINTEGKPVTYAKVVLPSEKIYTQVEVIAIVDEARAEATKQVYRNNFVLPLTTKVYTEEDVEAIAHTAWNSGSFNAKVHSQFPSIGSFEPFFRLLKQVIDEKGIDFIKKYSKSV